MPNTLNARTMQKTSTEAEWQSVATTFQPLRGEVCVYLMTDGSTKIKVGDGTSYVGALPFVADELKTQIQSVEADVTAVEEDIATLEGSVSTVSGQVSSLSGQVSTHTSQISTLSSQVSTHTSQISTLNTQMSAKAPVASPSFTGTPRSTTPASTDNSTRIATTAFVKAVVSSLGGGGSIVVSASQPSGQKVGDLWYKLLN